MHGVRLLTPTGHVWKPRSYERFKLQRMQGRLSTAPNGNDPAETHSLGQQIVVLCLLFYKSALSPLLPSFCKFYPTCSVYAREAVDRHGVSRGLALAARRLLQCRPFSQGGVDPVPDA